MSLFFFFFYWERLTSSPCRGQLAAFLLMERKGTSDPGLMYRLESFVNIKVGEGDSFGVVAIRI